MSRDSSVAVNIFEYDDYRRYLRDLTRALKESRPHFSFRWFSKAAGFSSPNFLKLVMEGKRNLTADSTDRFTRAFKLPRAEADFFRNLVQLNQAKTLEQRARHAEELLRRRPYRELHPLKAAQYECYASWHLMPVRELVDTVGFDGDPAWIARQLLPPVTKAEAERALATLEQLGLLRRAPGGAWRQVDAVVDTTDEVTAASVGRFHREMIRLAGEAIDRFRREDREISSVTMSLSEEGMRQAKEITQRTRKELLELAARDRGQTAIYQFNFQLFPLSRRQAARPRVPALPASPASPASKKPGGPR